MKGPVPAPKKGQGATLPLRAPARVPAGKLSVPRYKAQSLMENSHVWQTSFQGDVRQKEPQSEHQRGGLTGAVLASEHTVLLRSTGFISSGTRTRTSVLHGSLFSVAAAFATIRTMPQHSANQCSNPQNSKSPLCKNTLLSSSFP